MDTLSDTADLPRYNANCRIHGCPTWARRGDVVCGRHYRMLPAELRRLLWSKKPTDWILALEWIDEHDPTSSSS